MDGGDLYALFMRHGTLGTGLELATASVAWLACPSEPFRRAMSPSYFINVAQSVFGINCMVLCQRV